MKKVVLITNGLSETSWFLIKEINNNFKTLVVSKFGNLSFFKKILNSTILIKNYFLNTPKKIYTGTTISNLTFLYLKK